MTTLKNFIDDTRGDGLVIEATIIFPIIIMFLAAVVLLSFYLPQRALMQEAAQFAAVAVATDRSDSWITFDSHGNRAPRPASLESVYIAAFRGASWMHNRWNSEVEEMIINHLSSGIGVGPSGDLTVDLAIRNFLVYKSVTVRVTQVIEPPLNFAMIGFATEGLFTQRVEARAIVSNGDEFVRNVRIAIDLMDWVRNRFGEDSDFGDTIGNANDSRIPGR